MLKFAVLLLSLSVAVRADWKLVWGDDFNGPAGSAPDSSKWRHDIGGSGWGNAELQHYTDSTNNAQLDGNGNLLITADTDDASHRQCWYGPCQYTSARLTTSGKFETTYGRFEARIKVPWGKGVWPAFWMLSSNTCTEPYPNCGEIEIMEMRGSDPTKVSGTIHGPGYSGAGGLTDTYYSDSRLSDDYHVYAIEWNPESITWYVDDTAYETHNTDDLDGKRWVFDHPFYLLLNFAVGGNYDGNPDGSTPIPQSMVVDYVRVYKKD